MAKGLPTNTLPGAVKPGQVSVLLMFNISGQRKRERRAPTSEPRWDRYIDSRLKQFGLR